MQGWGYLPAGAGLRTTAELLERGHSGVGEAFALVVQGRYRALTGDVRLGRADLEQGRALMREFGATFYAVGTAHEHGQLELEAGEPAAAELVLREAYDWYGEIGSVSLSTSAGAMLARALVDQGKLAEAESIASISAENAAAGDVVPQIESRSVRARVRARRGDTAGAEPLAREAVAIAETTDFLEAHADALLALAEVLALAGRAEDARPAVEEALPLYERKESALGAARVRARLREIAENSVENST
jgi:hypothetical protein